MPNARANLLGETKIVSASPVAQHRGLFQQSESVDTSSDEDEGEPDLHLEDDEELDPEERLLQRMIVRNFMARQKTTRLDELTNSQTLH